MVVKGRYVKVKADMETKVTIMADLPPPPKWFLPRELAQRWRINLRRIKRLRQQGKLPVDKFSERDFRFPVDKILELEKDGKFLQSIGPEPAGKPDSKTPGRRKLSKKKPE